MKIRQSNYELMRISSMFLIVVFHILFHGNVLENTVGGVHLLLTLVMCFTLVHVNSFILLMGYFNYNKKFSIKKFFTTFNMSWFYAVAIVVILCAVGLNNIGGSYHIINAISPLNYNYWFIVCYLVVYILSPFLNKLIANLSQREHRKLIIVLFFLFSLIPFITRGGLIANNGFTIIQFIFLYFIGAYLNKYPIRNNIHFKNYSHNKSQLIFGSLSIFFCLLHFVFVTLSGVFLEFNNMFLHDIGTTLKSNLFTYSAPFVIIQSIFYFVWFGGLKIQNRAINYVGGLVLGVYLIHDNYFLKQYLYKWLGLDTGTMISGNFILVEVFICAILIFVACLLIEFIRKSVFTFIRNRKISKIISAKFYKYIENF